MAKIQIFLLKQIKYSHFVSMSFTTWHLQECPGERTRKNTRILFNCDTFND